MASMMSRLHTRVVIADMFAALTQVLNSSLEHMSYTKAIGYWVVWALIIAKHLLSRGFSLLCLICDLCDHPSKVVMGQLCPGAVG